MLWLRSLGAVLRLVTFGLLLALPAQAVTLKEQRATELGSNLVCHRSLEATNWTRSTETGNGYSSYWFENDQDTSDPKVCGNVVVEGKRAIYTQDQFETVKLAPGLNGRPAALITGLVQGVYPSDEQWGTTVARAGRVGIRYYFKLGAGWQTTGDGPNFPAPTSCTNDKYTQLGQYFTANNNGFYWNGNARQLNFGLNPHDVIGDWIRLEHYVHIDANGNPGPHEVYFTNITRGYVRSAVNLDDGGPGKASLDQIRRIVHKYRAGTCAGSILLMYAIMAHWPTDSGQRIGAAIELEGGTVPPHRR